MRGDAYVVYMPPGTRFREVLNTLRTELRGRNWEVLNTEHIDHGMMKYGLRLQNKLLSVCKSQYLSQAIVEDQYVSLIIPCRITLFRELGSPGQPGRVVMGLMDPSVEADRLGLKGSKAAKAAAAELREVMDDVADYFR